MEELISRKVSKIMAMFSFCCPSLMGLLPFWVMNLYFNSSFFSATTKEETEL